MGLAGGLSPPDVIKNFEKGFGDVLSFGGIVIVLGAMSGGLLVASGRRGSPYEFPYIARW